MIICYFQLWRLPKTVVWSRNRYGKKLFFFPLYVSFFTSVTSMFNNYYGFCATIFTWPLFFSKNTISIVQTFTQIFKIKFVPFFQLLAKMAIRKKKILGNTICLWDFIVFKIPEISRVFQDFPLFINAQLKANWISLNIESCKSKYNNIGIIIRKTIKLLET